MKNFEENLKKKLQHFEESIKSYSNMHRADPAILQNIKVQLSSGMIELKKIASLAANVNSRELRITPFDKENMKSISSALLKSELGNVTDVKNEILLTLRPLTDEYKEKIKKEVKEICNRTKENLRQIRHDFLNNLKKEEKAEDERKRKEKEAQNIFDKCNKQIEEMLEAFLKR
jgi:ribosome recycling factor